MSKKIILRVLAFGLIAWKFYTIFNANWWYSIVSPATNALISLMSAFLALFLFVRSLDMEEDKKTQGEGEKTQGEGNVDNKNKGPKYNPFKSEDNPLRFKDAILLLVATLKHEGCSNRLKLETVILRYYETVEEQEEAYQKFYSIYNNLNKYDLSSECRYINDILGLEAKKEILLFLLEIAYADDLYRKAEEDAISKIAHELKIPHAEYVDLFNQFLSKYKKEKKIKEEEIEFKYSVLELLAVVLKADGRQMACELDSVKSTIRRYYKTDEEQKAALKQFQSLLKQDQNIDEICNAINQNVNYSAKSEITMELLAVAYADGEFSKSEMDVIEKIVEKFYYSEYEYKSILTLFLKKYRQDFYKEQKHNDQQSTHSKNEESKQSDSNTKALSQKEKEAYIILGVDSNASDAEVKKAYHILALKYHPDNASNLGEEAIRQSTETMQQIIAAWETVKVSRQIR